MVRYVLQEDKEMILSMMELVKDDFAGYKEEDFLAALSEAIGKNEAFIDDRNGTSDSIHKGGKRTHVSGDPSGLSEKWGGKRADSKDGRVL